MAKKRVPTQRERAAKGHAKRASEHEKFIVLSAYIDPRPEVRMPDGNPPIMLNVDAHYWPMGDYQILLDMIEDDFTKRQKQAVLESLRKERKGTAPCPLRAKC